MKILIFILTGTLAFTLCTASLYAVESKEVKKFYWGPVFGMNLAQWVGDDSDAVSVYGGGEKKSRIVVTAGAFVHFGIGKRFAIEPQLLYSQKGAIYGGADPAVNDKLILKQNYLELPIFLCVYATPNLPVKVNTFFWAVILDTYSNMPMNIVKPAL